MMIKVRRQYRAFARFTRANTVCQPPSLRCWVQTIVATQDSRLYGIEAEAKNWLIAKGIPFDRSVGPGRRRPEAV